MAGGRNRLHFENPADHCTHLHALRIQVEALQRQCDQQLTYIHGLEAQISAMKRAAEREPHEQIEASQL